MGVAVSGRGGGGSEREAYTNIFSFTGKQQQTNYLLHLSFTIS